MDPKNNYLFVYYDEKTFTEILERSAMKTIDFEKKSGYSGHDWLSYFVRVIK